MDRLPDVIKTKVSFFLSLNQKYILLSLTIQVKKYRLFEFWFAKTFDHLNGTSSLASIEPFNFKILTENEDFNVGWILI